MPNNPTTLSNLCTHCLPNSHTIQGNNCRLTRTKSKERIRARKRRKKEKRKVKKKKYKKPLILFKERLKS